MERPPTPLTPRRGRRWTIALALALASGTVADAAAAEDDETIAIASAVGVIVAVDSAFAIYDLVALADGLDTNTDIATMQLVMAGAQNTALNIAVLALGDEEDLVFGLSFPSMLTGALTAHGAWSLAQQDADQGTKVLGSTLIGINQAYTVAAISHALEGKPSSVPTAIGQLLTAGPTAGISAYQLATADSFRSGWLFLSAWSGALLLHGTASLFIHADDDDDGRGQLPNRRDVLSLDIAPTMSVTPGVGSSMDATVGLVGTF